MELIHSSTLWKMKWADGFHEWCGRGDIQRWMTLSGWYLIFYNKHKLAINVQVWHNFSHRKRRRGVWSTHTHTVKPFPVIIHNQVMGLFSINQMELKPNLSQNMSGCWRSIKSQVSCTLNTGTQIILLIMLKLTARYYSDILRPKRLKMTWD